MELEANDCGLGVEFTRRRNAALAALLPPLAHRLNNGLAAVVGLGELVSTRPDAPAVKTLAETVDSQARDVVGLVRTVSGFAKPLDGPPEKIDAVHEIERVRGLLEPVCQATGVALEVDLPEVMPTEVVARALGQLLVVCGVEVAAPPEPRALRIVARRLADSFTLDITAHPGPGLEPAVWAPVGITLAGVQASSDGGHVLRLCLPALGAQVESPSALPAAVPAQQSVLVFERDPQLADLVEAVLSEGGFEVVTATEPETVRRAAMARHFDLLLVDEGSDPTHLATASELVGDLRSDAAMQVGTFGEGALVITPPVGPALAKPFRPAELLAYTAERLG